MLKDNEILGENEFLREIRPDLKKKVPQIILQFIFQL